MDETDFLEYGRQCEMLTPWRGYRRGTIVAKTARGFVVQFSSGAEIEVYEDEIEFDWIDMCRLMTPQLEEALKGFPLYSQNCKGKEAVCRAVFAIGSARWLILEREAE